MIVKPACLTIHTERLHDDRVWHYASAFADYLHKRGLSAVWFSINPTHEAYQRMGFDEKKWIERLRYLTARGQRVEQHTHFYKGIKGVYDLTPEHMAARLCEDRAWLESHGHAIRGFVSGAWIMNETLMALLSHRGYAYDCTARVFSLPYLAGRGNELMLTKPCLFERVREIPTTHALKDFWRERHIPYTLVYMHDYDMLRLPFRMLLRVFLIKKAELYDPLELPCMI